MSERLSNEIIDLKQRVALLKRLSVFSTLSPLDIEELAALMQEVTYYPGQIIVTEDDLIDSVFMLVQGRAEVSHQQVAKRKLGRKPLMKKVPLATIGPGDAIGLNDTGFFSTTGKRTATIMAMTEVLVLNLNLKELHEFLREHPNIQSEMYAASGQLLRIKLIKQSLPFSRLSHERLQWLANQVEDLFVPAGTIIFRQGDAGDRCYLIQSGQVEIDSHNENDPDKKIAILKTPTLFGEATLITHSPRNATARAIEDCQLLVLQHKYLSELIETEKNVADMFMTLMVDRSKPLKNPNILAHHRKTADQQNIVILKNPDNGNYFKLSAEGWYIWEQLNGENTMQAITLSLAEKFKVFAPDVVAALISKLAKSGFILNVQISDAGHLSSQPFWIRGMMRLRRLLEARVAFGDADKKLTSIYNKGVRFLFTRLGLLCLSIIAISGFFALGFATPHVLHIFKTIPDSWTVIFLLIPFAILSVGLHEMGHAFTTKSFGYEVHYMGVGWYWLAPVAFTDTSDMWLSSKWPRTAVNLAGIGTDLITAGVAASLIHVIPNLYVQAFLWIFAVYTYFNAFKMLSPLQELDGYYVLMDLLDRPRLRQSSVKWLVKIFPKSIRHPSLFRKHGPEVWYWLACLIFLI